MKNNCIIFIVLLLAASACSCGSSPDPVHRFESYAFDSRVPVPSRVSLPPEGVLAYLRKLDDRPDYAGYMPNGTELLAIRQSFDMLPPLIRSVMADRLLGIYFIPGFMGSGLTEWVVDGRGRVYAFMVLNPAALKTNASALLTAKEHTCFINDDPDYSVEINAGTRHGGILYILLHESVHVIDYVMNVTPYVDDSINELQKKGIPSTPFTSGIWKTYNKPLRAGTFTGRIFFYGLKKPQLRMSEAPAVYRELIETPFVSLYASQSWAEDLSEIATFYHLAGVLGQPYEIVVKKRGKTIMRINPMDSPEVRKRLGHLRFLYGGRP